MAKTNPKPKGGRLEVSIGGVSVLKKPKKGQPAPSGKLRVTIGGAPSEVAAAGLAWSRWSRKWSRSFADFYGLSHCWG
jgi:hypothetical protein